MFLSYKKNKDRFLDYLGANSTIVLALSNRSGFYLGTHNNLAFSTNVSLGKGTKMVGKCGSRAHRKPIGMAQRKRSYCRKRLGSWPIR
jgi:hypothetical protein